MNTTVKSNFIGTGGVYHVDKQINGSYLASCFTDNYYITELAPERVATVERMISFQAVRRLNGSLEDRILWPCEIINDCDGTWCVLKIPNRHNFDECSATLKGLLTDHITVKPAVLYRICASITEVYSLLNTLGFYFNIYSLDDILLDLTSGDICIKNTHMLLTATDAKNISGTPVFMATETIEGVSGINRFTNVYSCLTYLFCMIYRVHPLHSTKRRYYSENAIAPDNDAIKEIYGFNAEFCFSNSANALTLAAEAPNWNETPEKVRELFTTLYTKGIADSKARPSLSDANAVFTQEAEKFPSTSFFAKPLFPFITPKQKNDDANYTADNIPTDYRIPIDDISLFGMLNSICGQDLSVEGRGGCFYLKNNTPTAISFRLGSDTMCGQLLPGCEIKLSGNLSVELCANGSDIITLKFI